MQKSGLAPIEVIGLLMLLVFGPWAEARGPIRVITDRTESHLKPMLARFQVTTGIAVETIYLDQGLLERLAARPTEADVVITRDAELMEIARGKGLLQPFVSAKILDAIPSSFREKDSHYFIDAFRARVIFYSKDRVKPQHLSTYDDLALPKWKSKICMRSGYHDYNVALFSQMVVAYGPKRAEQVIEGLHNNLARVPIGNDREQAKAIFETKCDVALMNTYYHPIMVGIPEQRPWAEATGVFYPDQAGQGAFIMQSALALTRARRSTTEAVELLDFFASAEGQSLFANITFQFPTRADLNQQTFKINRVSLRDAASRRDAVVKKLNQVQFDQLK